MPQIRLITFRVHDMRLGVDILSVVEVLPRTPIHRLPAAPEYLAGVIHWRGHIVPVISVRARFGVAAAEPTDRTRIVLTTLGNDTVGLLVDEVHQIVRVNDSEVQPPAAAMAAALAEYFRGVVRIGEEMILLIDTGRIVSSEEHARIQRTVPPGSVPTPGRPGSPP